MRLRLLLLCALGLGACRSVDFGSNPRSGDAAAAAVGDVRGATAPAPGDTPPANVEQGGALEMPEANASQPAESPAQAASAAPGVQPAVVVADPTLPVSNEDPDVRSLLEEYYRDYAAGNGAALAEHFWPEATMATIRGRALGDGSSVVVMRVNDYVRQHMGAGARATPLRISLESSRIETIGSVASAVTYYRAVDPSGQESQSWRGADLFSLVRHEGRWRIASLVFEGARFGR